MIALITGIEEKIIHGNFETHLIVLIISVIIGIFIINLNRANNIYRYGNLFWTVSMNRYIFLNQWRL